MSFYVLSLSVSGYVLSANSDLPLQAPRAPHLPAPAGPGSCNPLFEDNCNPLTATRYSSPPDEYRSNERDEAAAIRVGAPPPAEQSDPYAMFRDAYANANRVTDPYAMYRQHPTTAAPQSTDPYDILRRFMSQAQDNDRHAPRMSAPESNPNDPFSPVQDAMSRHGSLPPRQYPFSNPSYEEPAPEERHPLGPPGKTKEGYDCYIGYDRDCFPVRPSQPRAGAPRHTPYPADAYQPQQSTDGPRSGVLEPDNPHCDPEYDRDCRLRRYDPPQPEHHTEEDHSRGIVEPEQHGQDQYESEPYQSGQEEPYMAYPPQSQGMPSLQDILRSYGDRFPDQDDHRAYADDYRKK